MEETAAQHLFELIREYASLSNTSICMLHNAEPKTPCPQSKFFCGKESIISAVNFDAVKDVFCNRNKLKTLLPSVDAVLYKKELFIFVEIKGWQNFDRYYVEVEDSPSEIQIKADKQAKKFNLKLKIDSSIEICKNISKDPDIFTGMPMVYVLVTDVDTVLDPLVRFRARLGILSYNAINIPFYTSASNKAIKATGMNIRYQNCRNFDKFFDSL